MKIYIFSITFAFGFSIIGLLINNAIKNKPFYSNLSNFNFIKSDAANRYLAVLLFRKIVIKSFWRHFNPILKIKERPNREKLIGLRNEMTYAEVSHLIAFMCVLIVAVFFQVKHLYKGAFVPILISNVIFHLYPPLVQQYNKRRLDTVINQFPAKVIQDTSKL